MKAIKYTLILATAIFALNSCTKEVAGPAGPQGSTGAQGASSSYAVTIDSVLPSAWRLNSTTSTYDINIAVNALTSPNFSIVTPYFSTSYNSLTSTWYSIPIGNILSSGDAFTYSYYTYNVGIQYAYSSAPTQKLYFKVVVITQP